MKTVGDRAPDFSVLGVANGKPEKFSLKSFRSGWLVLFFYPKDFTFICPTEIKAFHETVGEFKQLNCEVAGISVDSIETHQSWIQELGGLKYPLLSDPDRKLCEAYGVFNSEEKVANRASFIIDSKQLIRYAVVYHVNVGRSVEETLRVLKALQTQKLCPADWKPGEETGDLSNRF
ncbi:MAG: peroxiredoxin [Candidatus Omnitrophica bacterium]|nr:peroxiredoxin [Candidatus Omnitrophota bacterium]